MSIIIIIQRDKFMNPSGENYLKTLARSDLTKKAYRYALKDYFAIADNEISVDAYEKFLVSLHDYSPSTKRVKIAAVTGYYNFLDAWTPQLKKLNDHYIEPSQTDDVTFNREAIEKTISYCDTLRANLRELRDRAFVLTLADSGLRLSELTSLKRGNIEWQDQRAIVRRKRNKKKLVRFSERSIKALQEYLSARAKLDGATNKALNSLPLFARHDISAAKKLKPVGVSGMWKAIKERIEQAGVKKEDVRLHDFRHYFVTVSVIARGLKIAKELADHESVSTTNRYAHYADTELDIAYDEIFNRRIK